MPLPEAIRDKLIESLAERIPKRITRIDLDEGVLIGQPQALAIAVNTVKAARRLTGLAQRPSR